MQSSRSWRTHTGLGSVDTPRRRTWLFQTKTSQLVFESTLPQLRRQQLGAQGFNNLSIYLSIYLSYPILSYLILSYPILSYLILSYPILSYLILSYPILSYLILSYPILSYLILSYPIYLIYLISLIYLIYLIYLSTVSASICIYLCTRTCFGDSF